MIFAFLIILTQFERTGSKGKIFDFAGKSEH